MESSELKAHLGRAQITKLKALGAGIQVGKVLGPRLLVKLVHSYTEMDRVEKEGLLHIPKSARDANQPLPSTGIVVQLGDELTENWIIKYGIWTEWHCDWPLVQGSMIMFSRFAGTDFRVDEQDFRILEFPEVMCTLIDTLNVVVPIAE